VSLLLINRLARYYRASPSSRETRNVHTSYIVTFIGDDRPGLVEAVSRIIEDNGGNWLESRLAQLGGQFAGLLRVNLPAESGAALEADLAALSSSGLSVSVAPAVEASAPAAGRAIGLEVIGPDRPGIVREISRALAARQINVIEMESTVSSAPMSAEPIFQAHIEARIPDQLDVAELQASLDEIADRMTLEIELD